MSFGIIEANRRPITILDDGIPLTSDVGSIDLTGVGVNATATGDAVTANFPAAGGLSPETPSGDLDGVNKDFTAVHNPSLVVLNGATQTVGVDYSVSGSGPYTISFVFAPLADDPPGTTILRSYY